MSHVEEQLTVALSNSLLCRERSGGWRRKRRNILSVLRFIHRHSHYNAQWIDCQDPGIFDAMRDGITDLFKTPSPGCGRGVLVVWSILAEHFVGFRLIDSPWKIYQHPRLWNILLDKWKWMMQVPCCNIWISEKKVFWKLFGPLDPWFLSNMKNFVLLLGRLYVGILGDKRGWVGPHLCLTVY